MAHNDDITRIIIEPSVAREPRVRLIGPDGDAHWVKETPMELIWPNGDPVARDKEMLVERITEDEARAYAGLAGAEVRGERELLNEIERLRAELKDADDDFHALKAMFDKMRDDLSESGKALVAKNEALRLFMRNHDIDPKFEVTEKQNEFFKKYGGPYGEPGNERHLAASLCFAAAALYLLSLVIVLLWG